MDQLQKWRREIDQIDRLLIKILGKRFQITKKIQGHKEKYGLPPYEKDREGKIIRKLEQSSSGRHLPKYFLQNLYTTIFKYSRESKV